MIERLGPPAAVALLAGSLLTSCGSPENPENTVPWGGSNFATSSEVVVACVDVGDLQPHTDESCNAATERVRQGLASIATQVAGKITPPRVIPRLVKRKLV